MQGRTSCLATTFIKCRIIKNAELKDFSCISLLEKYILIQMITILLNTQDHIYEEALHHFLKCFFWNVGTFSCSHFTFISVCWLTRKFFTASLSSIRKEMEGKALKKWTVWCSYTVWTSRLCHTTKVRDHPQRKQTVKCSHSNSQHGL